MRGCDITAGLPTSCVQLMKTVLQVDEHSHQGTASVNMKRHAIHVERKKVSKHATCACRRKRIGKYDMQFMHVERE